MVPLDGDIPADVADNALEEVDNFKFEFDEMGVMEIPSECCGGDVVCCWSGCWEEEAVA